MCCFITYSIDFFLPLCKENELAFNIFRVSSLHKSDQYNMLELRMNADPNTIKLQNELKTAFNLNSIGITFFLFFFSAAVRNLHIKIGSLLHRLFYLALKL